MHEVCIKVRPGQAGVDGRRSPALCRAGTGPTPPARRRDRPPTRSARGFILSGVLGVPVDPVVARVGLLTAGVAAFFVGLGILIVGAAQTAAGPILGFAPGVPQVALGGLLMAGGYGLGWAGWRMAFPEGLDVEEE